MPLTRAQHFHSSFETSRTSHLFGSGSLELGTRFFLRCKNQRKSYNWPLRDSGKSVDIRGRTWQSGIVLAQKSLRVLNDLLGNQAQEHNF